jgi:hypothetical protein
MWLGQRHIVMAGLVPAMHGLAMRDKETWVPGTSPGMTTVLQISIVQSPAVGGAT